MADLIKLNDAEYNNYAKTIEGIPETGGKAGELIFNTRNKLIGVKDFKLTSFTQPLPAEGNIIIQPYPFPQGITSTYFEKLVCLGYNTNLETLEAVVEIYQPYGYGGPCRNSLGSNEVVKFWADLTGDGDFVDPFEYLGEARVHVFDPCAGSASNCPCYKKLPINYAVLLRISLPKAIIEKYKLLCKCLTVKAQLMWNGIPYWGNTITRTVRFHK